jgi:hypothetical protein
MKVTGQLTIWRSKDTTSQHPHGNWYGYFTSTNLKAPVLVSGQNESDVRDRLRKAVQKVARSFLKDVAPGSLVQETTTITSED